MRQQLPKASVDAPTLMVSNAIVHLRADEDIDLEATVMNRQGTTLAIYNGPWTTPDPGRTWVITDPSGTVVITVQDGCGCGQSTVVQKAEPAPELVPA